MAETDPGRGEVGRLAFSRISNLELALEEEADEVGRGSGRAMIVIVAGHSQRLADARAGVGGLE
jgi:hypothetical protein